MDTLRTILQALAESDHDFLLFPGIPPNPQDLQGFSPREILPRVLRDFAAEITGIPEPGQNAVIRVGTSVMWTVRGVQ